MKPSDLIRICNNKISKKLSETSYSISDLMSQSISSSILSSALYSPDSVFSLIESPIRYSAGCLVRSSSFKLIEELNE